MTGICTPLRCILHYGFQRICEVPVVLQRLGRTAGERTSFSPLDGDLLLLLEAQIQHKARGLQGLPLLLLSAVLMAALLPLLVLARRTADFLERSSNEVRWQRDGEKCLTSAGAVLLVALARATSAAALP